MRELWQDKNAKCETKMARGEKNKIKKLDFA
jgi:hypothetical protein